MSSCSGKMEYDKIRGSGDLTDGGLQLSAILCCPANQTIERQRVTALEYHDSDNIPLFLPTIFNTIGSNFASELVILSLSPVTMYSVNRSRVPDTRLFLIVIVAIVQSIMVIREKADIDIPHTPSAWSELALERSSGFQEWGVEVAKRADSQFCIEFL